jgi:hypothetical protein
VIRFVPIRPTGGPVLVVTESQQGFLFQCLDTTGEVQVETYHVSLADALGQVSLRMTVEDAQCNAKVHYEVHSSKSRKDALSDAAHYLSIRAEKLRGLQTKDYSGQRRQNINNLRLWAREIRKLP